MHFSRSIRSSIATPIDVRFSTKVHRPHFVVHSSYVTPHTLYEGIKPPGRTRRATLEVISKSISKRTVLHTAERWRIVCVCVCLYVRVCSTAKWNVLQASIFKVCPGSLSFIICLRIEGIFVSRPVPNCNQFKRWPYGYYPAASFAFLRASIPNTSRTAPAAPFKLPPQTNSAHGEGKCL